MVMPRRFSAIDLIQSQSYIYRRARRRPQRQRRRRLRRRPSSFSNRNECSRGFLLWLSRDFSPVLSFQVKKKSFNQLNVIIFGRDIFERAAGAAACCLCSLFMCNLRFIFCLYGFLYVSDCLPHQTILCSLFSVLIWLQYVCVCVYAEANESTSQRTNERTVPRFAATTAHWPIKNSKVISYEIECGFSDDGLYAAVF